MEFVVPNNIGSAPLVISINGVRYSVGAGQTVDIPEAVVAEIQRMMAVKDKAAPGVEPPFPAGGGSGGVLVVQGTFDESIAPGVVSLDKTWAEINAADAVVVVGELSPSAGGTFKIRTSEVETGVYDGQYTVSVSGSTLATDSPDGYPVAVEQQPIGD